MSAPRPLPARPSLEYERKEAKALLRRLRAGDPDALARARPFALGTPPKLADAQLVIAREYGFASWPRLVRYFGDVERQRHGGRFATGQLMPPAQYEAVARSLLAQHRARRPNAGYQLAAGVPRLYAASLDEVFAATITDDEARLAVARSMGAPSWDLLIERAAGVERRERDDPSLIAMRRATTAMRAGDLATLERLTVEYPLLLEEEWVHGWNLMRAALRVEQERGADAMRPVVEWLTARGFDRQRALNLALLGHMRMTADEVRGYLALGADPNWTTPAGFPVLEHALLRYWNGDAVDLLAAHVTPRKALWIAAGLGDVDGVRRMLDARGRPTRAARLIRADFIAVGLPGVPWHPDPSDDELLLEAFVVAMLNGRVAVLEYLASRGFDVNTLLWESPLINVAVGSGILPVVECLVRLGADLDQRGRHPDQSPREIARSLLEGRPDDPTFRRVAELFGLDVSAVIAASAARPRTTPELSPQVRELLALASDDARRQGASEVTDEHLLFGTLRSGGLSTLTATSGADVERLLAEVTPRLRPRDDRLDGPPLPLGASARAVLDAAIEAAAERREIGVMPAHLHYALVARPGYAGDLLARHGGNAAVVHEYLGRAL